MGWWVEGAPVIGGVLGPSPDVVIGAQDNKCWSWSNAGDLNQGYPKEGADPIDLSPALGDLDLDGSVELVVLT